MGLLLFVVGLLGAAISIIILIIKAIRRRRKITAVILLIIFLAVAIVGVALPTEDKAATPSISSTPAPSEEPAKEEENKIILDDDYITAEFIGFEDHPELEMFAVFLRVTNKTDQKIWVYLDEASVNDEMMQLIASGTPLYILPEKKGSNGFIFYFKQISIDKFDDVEKVSFKIGVKNEETLADIEMSPEITITK